MGYPAKRKAAVLQKMLPPNNKPIAQLAKEEGIAQGTIAILATDHAPHPMHTKEKPFSEASFGIVGLDCALALYAKALIDDGVLDWSKMLAMMTTNPASLINRPDLGRLTIGNLADITIIDPNLQWTIDAQQFASTARNCPFDGWEVKGKAIATIYGGSLVHQSLGNRINHCENA